MIEPTKKIINLQPSKVLTLAYYYLEASYLFWPLDHYFWKSLKLNCHCPYKYAQFFWSWPSVFWIYREYLCGVWCWKWSVLCQHNLGSNSQFYLNILKRSAKSWKLISLPCVMDPALRPLWVRSSSSKCSLKLI